MHSYTTDHQHNAFAAVDAWNDAHDICAPVTFTSGLDSSIPVQTRTIGAAYMDNSQPMICVECCMTPVRLSQVKFRQ
jgi:hypothetical protein